MQDELYALELALPSPVMAIYDRVGPHVGLTPENLVLLVRVLWSIALVLSPIVLLPLLAVELSKPVANGSSKPVKVSNREVTRSSKASQAKGREASKPKTPDRHDTGTSKGKGNRYNEVKQEVILGKVRPSRPAIKKGGSMRSSCG